MRGPAVAALLGACLVWRAAPAGAQQPEPATRTALIERAQAEKTATPYKPGAAEKYLDYAENYLTSGQLHWHPFFDSAYAGGGFTLGAGYLQHVGSYNVLDLRGSPARSPATSGSRRQFTRAGAVRAAGQPVVARRLARGDPGRLLRRWGTSTSKDSRANYGFKQPYGSATARRVPGAPAPRAARRLRGLQWKQTPGRRQRAVRRNGLHAGDAARPRRAADLPPFAGHGRDRLAPVAAATRGAADSTA